MKQGTIETIVGFLILMLAFGFFIFAYNMSNFSKSTNGYELVADFQNIDGILKGSDIKIAGIKVGIVDKITLEHDNYYAVLHLKINKGVNIPTDSTALVSTTGILGSRYIKINPGANTENFANGDKIKITQPALNIEDLINKLVYTFTTNTK